ncbi:MAG: hypothetical protein ACTSXT_11755 [Candidatus Helarchaeota archaeon]
MAESPPVLQPRDILSPSATLLGFVFTTLGITLTFLTEQEEILKNISYILIGAILFIVLSAILTILATYRKSLTLWNWARRFYIASWGFLGIVSILVLVGKIFGFEILQITLPEFNQELVTGLSALLSLIVGFLSSRIGYISLKKEIETQLESFEIVRNRYENEIDRKIDQAFMEEDEDLEMTFFKIAVNIEKNLRSIIEIIGLDSDSREFRSARNIFNYLIKKGVITGNLINAFNTVWNIRNNIAHGEKVYSNDLKLALDLSALLLVELEKIRSQLGEKRE